MTNTLIIKQPDDWHCHLRDEPYLARTVFDAARLFSRIIVMPNLKPPVTTVKAAAAYFEKICRYIPKNKTLRPLMTLYLTEKMAPQEILAAKTTEFIHAVKLYPAGATTHSADGIADLQKIYPILETMQKVDFPLLIHGESIEPSVDIFDREAVFIEKQLSKLVKNFPSLRIVLEHVSSKTGVDFVTEASDRVAATITPHHLHLTRQQLLSGGLRPHYYCLPILKTERDRTALLHAATSGNAKFFLGTDSAPHSISSKQSSCCAAGIYNMPVAMELLAEIFEKDNNLDRLEAFSSKFGAKFYGFQPNKNTITLRKIPWKIPKSMNFGDTQVIPFMAGSTLKWQATNEYH